MKKEVLMSCVALLTLAVAQAASVSTSNTVALVKKEAVIANGWQLLVVPVADMDITQGDNHSTAIAIADMLPPAKYVGYTVKTVGTTSGMYNCTEADGWGSDATLAVGTVFWLSKTQSAASFASTSEATETPDLTEVIFCGNVQPLVVPTLEEAGTVVALGNASTEELKINTVAGEYGTQLFCLQTDDPNTATDESKSYKVYTCTGVSTGEGDAERWNWIYTEEITSTINGNTVVIGSREVAVTDDDVIVPAEAFYYFKNK